MKLQVEYVCQIKKKTREVTIINPDGTVEYHPYGTEINGKDGLMEGCINLLCKSKRYAFYVNDIGITLPINRQVRFIGLPYPVRGKIIRAQKERRCGMCMEHLFGFKVLDRACGACGKSGPTLKCCAGCHAVCYCNPTCQRADWQLHRKTCKSKMRGRSCKVCGKSGPVLKCCARCHAVCYCGRTCQRADWELHRKTCEENK